MASTAATSAIKKTPLREVFDELNIYKHIAQEANRDMFSNIEFEFITRNYEKLRDYCRVILKNEGFGFDTPELLYKEYKVISRTSAIAYAMLDHVKDTKYAMWKKALEINKLPTNTLEIENLFQLRHYIVSLSTEMSIYSGKAFFSKKYRDMLWKVYEEVRNLVREVLNNPTVGYNTRPELYSAGLSLSRSQSIICATRNLLGYAEAYMNSKVMETLWVCKQT